ncbi:hypothetical protein lb338_phage_142 [Lactobacillus phage Lb338-1]|uniref:Uncharacterized protein n=1 Tax=Lactobacillus phage Lb338-1 TaxID=2892342 RepID=C1KFQ2_9CAUD|nr:anti-sigma factor [Lactobacillus phage Lb338-1]ACO37063.1 hypothetical protein lb338_phage_142 [Lactobacillus phage Lb338-1]
MRVEIGNKIGVVAVDKEGKPGEWRHVYKFSVDTLPYWYPLNLNYYYEYDERSKEIRFRHRNSRISAKIKGNYLNVIKWYNAGVYADNKRIEEHAHALGISSIFDDYNSLDVSKGFLKVGQLIDDLTMKVIRHHPHAFESGTGKLDIYNQEAYALKHCTKEENLEYTYLGEIYNMLCLMKKVASKNELE